MISSLLMSLVLGLCCFYTAQFWHELQQSLWKTTWSVYYVFLIGFYCRILTDLDAPKGAHLMGPSEEGSLNIVTLLLTGRATPYLHNGVIYVGDEDHYVWHFFVNISNILWSSVLNDELYVFLGLASVRNFGQSSSWFISIRNWCRNRSNGN